MDDVRHMRIFYSTVILLWRVAAMHDEMLVGFLQKFVVGNVGLGVAFL